MTRRPMMYITSFFSLAIITSYYFGPICAMIPVILFMAVFIVRSEPVRIKSITVLLLISYLAGVISFSFEQARGNELIAREGSNIGLSCRVTHIELRKTNAADGSEIEYLNIRADVIGIEGQRLKNQEKILIRYYGERESDGNEFISVIPGKLIHAAGIIEIPAGRRNPGCFDYKSYLGSIGIKTIMTADEVTGFDGYNRGSKIEDHVYEIQGKIYTMKEMFISHLEEAAGMETAGFMRAVMFGEKTDIEEETLDEFRENGTAHVLAVSGLHIGMIYGFLSVLWRWKKGKLFFLTMIIFFTVYMAMASFAPSVVRAVIMVWIHVFATLTNRRYDMASAAFFTALMMLMANPMYVFNAGFQMSFLAVLTLSLMIPVVKKIYSGVFLGSLAIQLGLTPYTIYVFNYFSAAAVLVNVPVIFLTGIIVPAGMCCMVSMYISGFLFDTISKVLFGLCRIMTELNSLTTIEGLTVFDVRSPDVWIVALYYLSLLFFVSEDGRLLFIRRQKKRITCIAAAVITASLIFGYAAGNPFKNSDVVFVDVGQGDCIHFRAGRSDDYLVDGGGSITYDVGKKTLKPYLLKNGAKDVDGAFVTHLHTDHYKGIAQLCREGMVDRLYVYEGYRPLEQEILEDTGLRPENITYLYAGQKVLLDDETYVEILRPKRLSEREYEKLTADEEDENSLSLIMRITVQGRTILATGDVDADCLDSLAAEYGTSLKTDILKVAHHGSKYSDSETFMAASSPLYAVFQVGKNNFGHPDKGIVEKIRRQGIIVYRNDEDGAVAFDFKGKDKLTVKTVKGE